MEIIPRTMELLFIDYLEEKGLLKESSDLREIFQERMTRLNHENNFLAYSYRLADFISYKTSFLISNGMIDLETFAKKIYQTDYEKIILDTKEAHEEERRRGEK